MQEMTRPRALGRPQKRVNQSVSQPVLVLPGTPPAFAHQHPVYVAARQHPEDVSGVPVTESRAKLLRVAQRSNHRLLALVANTFPLLFELRQFRRNYSRAAQQVEPCPLRIMNLPGDSSCPPEPRFRVSFLQCFPDRALIIGSKRGLVEKFGEDTRLRPEDGINRLHGDLSPPCNCVNRHSGVALGFEKLPRGLDNPPAGLVGLTLASQRFISAP